jgi:trimethylamine--corrinoid protein Co-methyltransferase
LERCVPGNQREGVLVRPWRRISQRQIRLIDGLSRDLLEDPGVLCYNAAAAEVFRAAGARIEDAQDCVRIRVPASVIDGALDTAPSTVVLGARDPANRLILAADQPRVRFGTGSETNIWLDVRFEDTTPKFTRQSGSIRRLRDSAHLCEHLPNVDFFIRNVNIRDAEVTSANKDVNQFFTSLNGIRKHVQAGLTSVEALDDVVRLGEMVAGGADAFRKEPLLSFITCVIKSPLQIVDDTATKLIEISKRGVPAVISSCPMGGATGPFDEFGMVAQINAEVLAGIALNQLVAPGAPVLYGAVPVRTRLDNLNDMYAAPEVIHYTLDCAQMARFYGLPCYSTAGVADASVPGIQATAEKMSTLLAMPASGAQYIHYAFGLLERTNVFCPEQAVLDDAHIELVKRTYGAVPPVRAERREEVLSLIREVMATPDKTYMYHLPLPSRDPVYARFPLEDEAAGALAAAHRRYREIMALPGVELSESLRRDIQSHIAGILPAAWSAKEGAAT